jgi:hypothetical protein
MHTKEVPLWVPFIFAGLNVVVLAYLETYISPQLSAVVYSLPLDLLIICSFLILSNAPKYKIVRMVRTSGVFGQMGAIICIASFLYLSRHYDTILSVSISLIIWALFNYFFIYSI